MCFNALALLFLHTMIVLIMEFFTYFLLVELLLAALVATFGHPRLRRFIVFNGLALLPLPTIIGLMMEFFIHFLLLGMVSCGSTSTA